MPTSVFYALLRGRLRVFVPGEGKVLAAHLELVIVILVVILVVVLVVVLVIVVRRGIGRQGIGSFVRSSYASTLCPVVIYALPCALLMLARDLHRGLFHRGWFRNTRSCLNQHGERHCCKTDTTSNNSLFETTPFEPPPYASPNGCPAGASKCGCVILPGAPIHSSGIQGLGQVGAGCLAQPSVSEQVSSFRSSTMSLIERMHLQSNQLLSNSLGALAIRMAEVRLLRT